jgi:hypothetical protein
LQDGPTLHAYPLSSVWGVTFGGVIMSKQFLLSGLAALALTAAADAQTPVATTTPQSSAAVDFGTIKGAGIVGDSETLGVVRDVVVTGDGRVGQLIIGEGGILGFNQTLRVLPVESLNLEKAGTVRLPGLTKEKLSQLPLYERPQPVHETVEPRFMPVSGANQAAPQSATTYIPAAPGLTAPAKTVAKAPAGVSPAGDVQVATVPSLDTEQEAAEIRAAAQKAASSGSGSSGMAPQQGTGSGASQMVSGGNQSQANSAPPPSETTKALNRDYARETKPAAQSSAAQAPAAPGTKSAAEPTPAPEAIPEPDRSASDKRWRVGKLVGATVRGQEDGLYVKDIRFAGGRQAVVTLAKTGIEQTRELPFDALQLGGRADDPVIALAADISMRAR